MRGALSKILPVVYFVVGILVANSHRFFSHLNTIRLILSAVLAVALWPLVLLGVNLHIR